MLVAKRAFAYFRKIFYLFIYLKFLAVLGLCCSLANFSLAAASRGYSLVVMCRLFIVVASLVVEHRL